MSLTAKDIAEIAKLLDASHFTSLDLTVGDFRLRMRRDGGWSRRDEEAEPDPSPDPAASSAEPAIGHEAGAPQAGEVDVRAPLLGNFYDAPRPGDPPFVEPGDAVDEDTTIGIIEVMKLMNPIRAGVRGTVVAVLAENGKAVEGGQPLVRVRVD